MWFLPPTLQFIILVVDSTDRERLVISKEELYRMLAHEVTRLCPAMMSRTCLFFTLCMGSHCALSGPLTPPRTCGRQLCWYSPISRIWRTVCLQQRSPITSPWAPSKTTPGTYSPAVHLQERGKLMTDTLPCIRKEMYYRLKQCVELVLKACNESYKPADVTVGVGPRSNFKKKHNFSFTDFFLFLQFMPRAWVDDLKGWTQIASPSPNESLTTLPPGWLKGFSLLAYCYFIFF